MSKEKENKNIKKNKAQILSSALRKNLQRRKQAKIQKDDPVE